MELKQEHLANNRYVNDVLERVNKNKERIEILHTFDLSYFVGENFFGDDGFQNSLFFNQHLDFRKENNE